MSTLLLVHGAWCAAWSWGPLIPKLELLKIPYKVIELPGHGQNTRPIWSVSLVDYADSVIEAAASIDGPVIAVGHSMGGMVISEAAAKASHRFQALAYLAAFLPRDGERLASLASKDKQSKLGGAIKPHLFKGSSSLNKDRLDAAFFNDCSSAEAEEGKSLLQENPIRPTFARVHLNAEFEMLPKHYIRCLVDHAITPPHQEWMASRYKLKSMQDIECGHMANYTAPKLVAAALAKIVTMETMAS